MISDGPPNPMSNTTNNCTKENCEGRVWIYYSNAMNMLQWGTINNNRIERDALDTLCHQLGYRNFDKRISLSFSQRSMINDSYPIWLTDIKCPKGGHVDNILQCDHKHCDWEENCHDHDNDVAIKCSEFIVSTSTPQSLSLLSPLHDPFSTYFPWL